MKVTERDALLGRIDERTRNIYALTEKQEVHLSKLNDNMLKHATQIESNKTSIKWIIRILSAIGTIAAVAVPLILWLG